MVAKVFLLFCAQAFLAQCISSQCLRPGYNAIPEGLPGPFAPWNGPIIADASLTGPWSTAPLAGLPYAEVFTPVAGPFVPAASNGGGFRVTSVSPIGVTGITMTSENVYEGPLAVSGAVPFLGTVALEGALPTAGAGAVAYGCGNGNVAMLSEDVAAYPGPYGYAAPRELGYGYPPLAFEAGIAPSYGYGFNRKCGAL